MRRRRSPREENPPQRPDPPLGETVPQRPSGAATGPPGRCRSGLPSDPAAFENTHCTPAPPGAGFPCSGPKPASGGWRAVLRRNRPGTPAPWSPGWRGPDWRPAAPAFPPCRWRKLPRSPGAVPSDEPRRSPLPRHSCRGHPGSGPRPRR